MRRSRQVRALAWGVLGLALAWSSLEAGASTYDFSYRLSGDRRVAPIQVFDDGRHTWLQFAPGQVMPAVFVQQADDSLQLAAYQQQGPYLVLAGTSRQIDLRIGDIVARAEYTGSLPRQTTNTASVGLAPGLPLKPAVLGGALPAGSVSARASAGLAADAPASRDVPWASPAPIASTAPLAPSTRAAPTTPTVSNVPNTPNAQPSSIASGAPTASLTAATAPATAVVMPVAEAEPYSSLEFDAALSDRNMRRVLERWARQAGWTFQAEHWTVDVDIPLVGAANFGADFRNAVRGLLAATELGERPLQPCFYSNRVLRVIALSQACDRTAAPVALAGRG